MKRQLFAVASLVIASLAIGGTHLAAGTSQGWHNRTDEAFTEARKSGKPVLVDLYAQWCGWCKVMEREVFTTPRFQQFVERFVLLRVDVEDGASGSELQQRFSADSLPTLLLLDPKQSLVGTIEGYLETDRLIARLESELEKYDAFLASYQRALASSDPGVWRDRARELHARGDGGRAAVLFERLLREGPLQGDDLFWTRLQLADAYRMDGRFVEARQAAAALRQALAARAAAPQGTQPTPLIPQISERVDLLLIFIAGGERDCAGAAGALAAFEHGHPRSPYLRDARRAYASLKSNSAAQCS